MVKIIMQSGRVILCDKIRNYNKKEYILKTKGKVNETIRKMYTAQIEVYSH